MLREAIWRIDPDTTYEANDGLRLLACVQGETGIYVIIEGQAPEVAPSIDDYIPTEVRLPGGELLRPVDSSGSANRHRRLTITVFELPPEGTPYLDINRPDKAGRMMVQVRVVSPHE